MTPSDPHSGYPVVTDGRVALRPSDLSSLPLVCGAAALPGGLVNPRVVARLLAFRGSGNQAGNRSRVFWPTWPSPGRA